MTFVPSWTLDAGPAEYLECDRCGDAVQPSGTGADWRDMWLRALAEGWSGVGTRTGRHLCPPCTAGASQLVA